MITMVSVSTPGIRSYAWPAEANKRRYCIRHSYKFAGYHDKIDARPAAWSKIPALLNELNNGSTDWYFWLDADTLIANPEIPVQSLLDEHVDLLISRDTNGINSGSFIVKRNERTLAFFQAVDKMVQYTDHPWWEQAAMMECIRRNNPPLKIRYLPQKILNSRVVGDPDAIFSEGDFICHFPAMNLKERTAHINRKLLGTEFRTRKEIPFIIAEKCVAKPIGAEVGVLKGEFSDFLLRNCEFGHFYCIDAWKHIVGRRDISNLSDGEHEQNYRETKRRLQNYLSGVTFLRSTSLDAADQLADLSMDFIYIDADHSFAGCLEDLQSFYPKVKPGGILAGHDYLDGDLPEAEFGVKSAVDCFCRENRILDLFVSLEKWPSWLIWKL